MVGKGDTKGSRIFHQCYLKCCKLQNLTPLSALIPAGNGKLLDFCVDRIKYSEWPPILNALSCDLSLHSVSIRCRQQVKTVLEHIDCERLAKTVNKRAVILTNFMLSNLLEAVSQLLANTTLLDSLLLEGLPLRIPYLNPMCEALLTNDSLRHVFLPRCLIGDAGCMAVCKAVRCLPNMLTLDLSGCEITPLGASYIADLLKHQKIHRYSENWVHTLRYRMPELDAMAGLRRVSLCGNPLGDAGAAALLAVLADDLWIKAMDLQNCELTEQTAGTVLHMLQSNTTLVVLDLRHNADVAGESLAKVRAALRGNESGGVGGQYSWLSNVSLSSSEGRLVKPIISNKNGINKDRVVLSTRNAPTKYSSNKTISTKREKEYAEVLEQQLREEESHRRQLEELNRQLVDQLKQLKQQQLRLWASNAASSGSEQSFQASSRSGARSSSSGSSCSVPIDQHTLSYIQQAFRDIYSFIKNNQCNGQCTHEAHEAHERPESRDAEVEPIAEEPAESEPQERAEFPAGELPPSIMPKKAQSAHVTLAHNVKVKKTTKSAHLLGQIQHLRKTMQMNPDMFEKQMGDMKTVHCEEQCVEEMVSIQSKSKKSSAISHSSSSSMSDSSDTLVSPHATGRAAPRDPPTARGYNGDAHNPRDGYNGDANNPRDGYNGDAHNPRDGYNGDSYNSRDGHNGDSYNLPRNGYNGDAHNPRDGYNGDAHNPRDGYNGDAHNLRDGYNGDARNLRDGYNGDAHNLRDGYNGDSYNPRDGHNASDSPSKRGVPSPRRALNPRDALYSSSDDDSS